MLMLQHTTRAFDADLEDLGAKIREMAELSEHQVRDAIEALAKRDAELAKRVISADDRVDALQRAIDDKAVAMIARWQPMAVDLRGILGALGISHEIERIADLAENVAKRVLVLNRQFSNYEVMLQIQRMAQLVLEQLRLVIQSYERRDTAAATEVWRKDQEIDALNNSLFRELLTYMMEDPHTITPCTHLLFCAKNIERMGDHATNIAEAVYYIVKGQALAGERPTMDITKISPQPPLT
jgi:phosphate transport system protein